MTATIRANRDQMFPKDMREFFNTRTTKSFFDAQLYINYEYTSIQRQDTRSAQSHHQSRQDIKQVSQSIYGVALVYCIAYILVH